MRYYIQSILAGLVCILLLPAASLFAQDDEMMGEMSPIQEKMMMPGPEHEALKMWVGHWSTTFTYREMPGTEGTVFRCDDHAELIYGGKFVKYVSNIVEGPMQGESTEYWGYDRRLGKYTYLRMDSGSNTWMTAMGNFNDDKSALLMEGTDYMPGPDGSFQPTKFNMEMRMDGKDKAHFKVMVPDGQGGTFIMVEGTSTRNM